MEINYVDLRCVVCGSKRRSSHIPEDQPVCDDCYGPMVLEKVGVTSLTEEDDTPPPEVQAALDDIETEKLRRKAREN